MSARKIIKIKQYYLLSGHTMTSPFLSRFLMLILFSMPFMAAISGDIGSFFNENSHLKMALGVVGSLIVLLLWTFTRAKDSTLHVRHSRLLFIFLGFLAWEFITLFWSKNIHLSSIALVQHSSFVVAFFLAVNLLSKKDFLVVLNVLVVALTFISIIGLLQYYFNDNIFIRNFFFQAVAPAATFVNKNMASHFVIMTLPISLVLFLFSNKKPHTVLYSIVFFLGTWYLLYIQARQAYLAAIVEFLALVLFLGLDFWKNKPRSVLHSLYLRKTKSFLAIMVLVSLSIAGNFTNQGWNANDDEKFKRLSTVSVEGGGTRISMWTNTLEMFKDHPLIGVGVGQWSEHYPLYYDKVAKDRSFNERTRSIRAHNEYLETLASVGLIGFAFLLWALFYIVRYIAVSLTNIDNKDRSIILSLTLSMLGFAVVAFFSFPIQVYLPAFMLMFFIAIVAQLHDSSTGSILKIKDKYYLSSLVIAALLLYSGNFVYKLLSAEYYHQKSLVSYNLGDFDSGLNYSSKARQINPGVWKHNQLSAVFLMKKNRFEEAIVLLKKANSVSPYNIFSLENLQMSYAQMGDIKQQISVLEKILEIDPLNVKASSILVRAFYIQKKYKEATTEYKRTKKNFEYFKGRSGFGPYHTNLAKTALLVGDYKFFGHIYDDLIEMDSAAENYVVYGIVEYQRTGNKTKAKELFKKAIEIDQSIDIPKEIRSDLEL